MTDEEKIKYLKDKVDRMYERMKFWRGEAQWHIKLNKKLGNLLSEHHEFHATQELAAQLPGEICKICSGAQVPELLEEMEECTPLLYLSD